MGPSSIMEGFGGICKRLAPVSFCPQASREGSRKHRRYPMDVVLFVIFLPSISFSRNHGRTRPPCLDFFLVCFFLNHGRTMVVAVFESFSTFIYPLVYYDQNLISNFSFFQVCQTGQVALQTVQFVPLRRFNPSNKT